MHHYRSYGPDTPTSNQLMDKLHAALGVEKINVLTMKQPPSTDAHPKVVRAYWMAKSMTNMWRTMFEDLVTQGDTYGLQYESGMPLHSEELDAFCHSTNDPQKITEVLRDISAITIERTIARYGYKMRTTAGMDEVGTAFRQADVSNREIGMDAVTLARLREPQWSMEAATKQGFRAARDAEWRLMGVLPEVALYQHGTKLSVDDALLALEGVGGTLHALADAHEKVFLAVRAVLRGTSDHNPDLPYQWQHFHLVQRHGRLTLDIRPEVFAQAQEQQIDIADPWTGCPSLPFLTKYHEWSASIAKRFYGPQFPRIQQHIAGQSTERIQPEHPADMGEQSRRMAT